MSINSRCPVCHSEQIQVFHEVTNIPVHIGILWKTKPEAINCPKGNIKLTICHECGLVWNVEFNEKLMQYTGAYDNSLHFSPTYQEYAKSVAQRLVQRYKIIDKSIIEIGSGRGDFLSLLCDAGNNKGIGFDPSFDGQPSDKRILLIQDYYSDKYEHCKGDLICSRYVLEHISEPLSFMKLIRQRIGDNCDSLLYFEVPNVLFILKNLSIWDIIYEHCTYFGLISLEKLFNHASFDSLALYESYEGQFIAIEASPTSGMGKSSLKDSKTLKNFIQLVNQFSKSYTEIIMEWKDNFTKFKANRKKTVIWGAGAKGISFVNLLDLKNEIEYIVDINPRKRDHYIPGTGQKIISPDDLATCDPDNIVIMNPIYKREIKEKLSKLGIHPNLYLAS